jgi:hypothetical protein
MKYKLLVVIIANFVGLLAAPRAEESVCACDIPSKRTKKEVETEVDKWLVVHGKSTKPGLVGTLMKQDGELDARPILPYAATFYYPPKTTGVPSDEAFVQIDFEVFSVFPVTTCKVSFGNGKQKVKLAAKSHLDICHKDPPNDAAFPVYFNIVTIVVDAKTWNQISTLVKDESFQCTIEANDFSRGCSIDWKKATDTIQKRVERDPKGERVFLRLFKALPSSKE